MLEKDNIIVFADDKYQTCDGLPLFSIIQNDLKSIMDNENENKLAVVSPTKMTRHPKVDMGLPPEKEGQEKTAKAGSTFDPKLIKGNCMLFKHINEVTLSMLSKMLVDVGTSNSVNRQKIKSKRVTENYGIPITEKKDKTEQKAEGSEDELLEELNQENKVKDRLQNLDQIFQNKKEGKRTHFLPGIDNNESMQVTN